MAAKNRKELKENELVGALSDKFDQVKPHLPKILIGFFAIVAVVLGINYYLSSRSAGKEAKSINMVLFMVESSAAGSTATLDQQIEEFPDDNATAWAYLLKGDRELGDGLGRIFEDKKGARELIQKSIKNFEKATKQAGDDELLKQRSLFSWARALESIGQFDEAAAKYQEVTEFTDSAFADLAKKGIRRVNHPDNREFYVLFERKENTVLTDDLGESAPTTNSGLPDRPNFTYPGEESVLLDGSATGTPSTSDPKQEAKQKTEPKKQDKPPAPPKDVIEGDQNNDNGQKAGASKDDKKDAPKSDPAKKSEPDKGGDAEKVAKTPENGSASPDQSSKKQAPGEKSANNQPTGGQSANDSAEKK